MAFLVGPALWTKTGTDLSLALTVLQDVSEIGPGFGLFGFGNSLTSCNLFLSPDHILQSVLSDYAHPAKCVRLLTHIL